MRRPEKDGILNGVVPCLKYFCFPVLPTTHVSEREISTPHPPVSEKNLEATQEENVAKARTALDAERVMYLMHQ